MGKKKGNARGEREKAVRTERENIIPSKKLDS